MHARAPVRSHNNSTTFGVLVAGRATLNEPISVYTDMLRSLGLTWYERDGTIVIDTSPRIDLVIQPTVSERSTDDRAPARSGSL